MNTPATWHLLQVSDALDEEFGSALAELVPLTAWEPARTLFPWSRPDGLQDQRILADPPLVIRRFPIVRGFARLPWSWLARTGASISAHLLRETFDSMQSPLICTAPYFAPVAERWPGPVIYWLTDLMANYAGANERTVHALDARMCRVATLVCPNSQRIADYLVKHAGCPPSKIRVVPNATRATNLLSAPSTVPAARPADLTLLEGPLAGVIGNLAGNMDWLFLERLVAFSQDFSWAFIGPTSMPIAEPVQSAARERVMRASNAHFLGKRPYGALASYARAFDVAVLPYRRCEPTYSGSSTRFYEHLAAGRPMLATRGFDELLHKEPLLRLVENAEQADVFLRQLQQQNFDDGLSHLRWTASMSGTWQCRAAFVKQEFELLRQPHHAHQNLAAPKAGRCPVRSHPGRVTTTLHEQ